MNLYSLRQLCTIIKQSLVLSTNPQNQTLIDPLHFVAHFSDHMDIISKERKHCILMGDFNIDLIKIDMQNQTKDFIHSLIRPYTLMHFTRLSANIHASLSIHEDGLA